MATVIVFGATSYLGGFVLDALRVRGIRAIALTRNPAVASILIRGDSADVVVCRGGEIENHLGERPQGIINLAYPKQEVSWRVQAANQALVDSICSVARTTECKRILHVSSQAVFGYVFDEPPQPVDAPSTRGDLYIESKIAAERLLLKAAKRDDLELAIIRLGNIIGSGSPAWSARLAQRILFGLPVGYDDKVGWSNATYARNAADYLVWLLDRSTVLRDESPYHHVAELGGVTWYDMLAAMATTIGRPPVLVSRPARQDGSLLRNSAKALTHAYKATPAGTYLRRGLAMIERAGVSGRALARLKVGVVGASSGTIGSPGPADHDRGLLDLMASEHPFESQVLPGWAPPTSSDVAMREIDQWLVQAGYVLASA